MIGVAVARALNHLLRAEPWARERLQGFCGSLIRITCGSFALHLGIASGGVFEPAADFPQADADVTIEFPQDMLFTLALGKEAVFARARLSGTADLAETLGFVFRNLRWDVEGDLAGVVGDLAAYRFMRLVRGAFNVQRAAARSLVANVAEYLRLESRLLIGCDDMATQTEGLAATRKGVDELERRIRGLER